MRCHFCKHDPDNERKLDQIREALATMEKHIMSAVSEFAAKQNAFNDQMDKAVADIQTEMKALNDQIATLQNSPGTITPEDQTTLDALQARASTIATKLGALDTLNPPAPPAA